MGMKDKIAKQVTKELGDAQREILQKRDKEMVAILDKWKNEMEDVIRTLINEELDKRK